MKQPTNEELLHQCLEGTLDAYLQQLAGTADPLGQRVQAALDFAALIKEAPLEMPPKSVQRAARAVAHPSAGAARVKLWLASLFTPTVQPQLAFRGATSAPQLFHAGPFELDVLSAEGGALVGELAPRDETDELPAAGTCSLFGAEGVRTTSIADGEFRFDAVEPGSYRLVLDFDLDATEPMSIVVPDLTV